MKDAPNEPSPDSNNTKIPQNPTYDSNVGKITYAGCPSQTGSISDVESLCNLSHPKHISKP